MTGYQFCPRCGTQREGDLAFCGRCGFAFEATSTDAASAEPVVRTDTTAESATPIPPPPADTGEGSVAPAPSATTQVPAAEDRESWGIAAMIVVVIAFAAAVVPVASRGGSFSAANLGVEILINCAIYLAVLAAIYGILRVTKHLPRNRSGVLLVGVMGSLIVGVAASLTLAVVINALPASSTANANPVWSMTGTIDTSGQLSVTEEGHYEVVMTRTGTEQCKLFPIGFVAEPGTDMSTAANGLMYGDDIRRGRADLHPGQPYLWKVETFGGCGWKMELNRLGDAQSPRQPLP